ncbi:A/G-specific adenine glycosylase [Wenzhouxiangella sp. XN201]|uniref:A/G-specific adenine glycosylase n=1 Tax=Wenzhouxiangella sp. XN201 TaxID=2710755 RepID=UPI0013CB8A73|nr:A/G-specific adenine glycosylase [Wenzhouxiangella sp. XN201]NEZ05141.1 A/G-specific adenine glycosylase [Wenzhouxiangella sp. XN201]
MPSSSTKTSFSGRLLSWWSTHGRHDLPWQADRTPYRVWIAEIMLQQTQVATVIPYFKRFMAAFPSLETLADADIDEVLAHWSGLGYYARARNLHAAARHCMSEHGGQVPQDPSALEALPGIGQSTANAIVAQAFDHRAAILDGNAKRVLARHAGIEGWPGRSKVLRQLWAEAEARTPSDRAADYTQAIMDLGATVCTPRAPDCRHCPVAKDCVARLADTAGSLPTPAPRKRRPIRAATMFIIENKHGQILLQRRPPTGIWGGLWSLPDSTELAERPAGKAVEAPAPIRHQFTHFTLDIQFDRIRVADASTVADQENLQWVEPVKALQLGLPNPIRKALEQLQLTRNI